MTYKRNELGQPAELKIKQDCLSIEGRPPANRMHRHASVTLTLTR